MTEKTAAAAPRGLEGVVATTTAISSVSDNFLQYRGYMIDELALKAEYEEVAYLLLNGDLPNKKELTDFKAELVKHRALSPFLRNILSEMSESGTPMDVLRTVVSASALEDPSEG
ncbi:MAG TPA: citrate/2-methylcitrate synthase, partial [Candidatus Limnocylindria bacterium]